MRGALWLVGMKGSCKWVICVYSSSQPVSFGLMVMTPLSTSCTSSSYWLKGHADDGHVDLHVDALLVEALL